MIWVARTFVTTSDYLSLYSCSVLGKITIINSRIASVYVQGLSLMSNQRVSLGKRDIVLGV
jgi:hypothetical protein